MEYDSTGMNITNSYEPEKTEVSGRKNMVDYDNKYNSRPGKYNNKLISRWKSGSHKNNKKDNWSWNFEDLPVYKNGQK